MTASFIVKKRRQWKKKKEQKARAEKRKNDYREKQKLINGIIEELWKDERFSSMMKKYQALGPGAMHHENVLRKVRKSLIAKIRARARHLMTLEEQIYFNEVAGRLKIGSP
jgi:ERCC4-type nuclease